MALIAPTQLSIEKFSGCQSISWLTTAADTFTEVEALGYADKSVQLIGAVGALGFNSSTIVLEGTNEAVPTTWATLTDTLGNALSFTASGLKQITEICRWIRPRITAGTPASVTILVIEKKV